MDRPDMAIIVESQGLEAWRFRPRSLIMAVLRVLHLRGYPSHGRAKKVRASVARMTSPGGDAANSVLHREHNCFLKTRAARQSVPVLQKP